MASGISGNKLHWSDWLVFAVMLLISLGIGVYHSLTGGKQRTTGEYLLGNRQMGLLPVTLSFAVSYVSTLTMLGYPAEMYAFGAQYWMGIWGGMLGAVLAAVIHVPLFYPLQLVSVNEYLGMRFKSRTVQRLGTFCTVANAIFYVGNVYYGPCAAIEAVSGFSVYWCIVTGGIVCLIYTTIGGLKAVIWSDVFQSICMLLGSIAVLIRGLVVLGGTDMVWELNSEWNRLNFFDFDPNPTKRMNFYGVMVGNALTWMGVFGFYQTGVQRYNSLPTMRKAKLTVMLAMPMMAMLMTLSCFIGLVVFAYYAKIGCDPIKEGHITSPNQILPYFIVDEGGVPLLAGIFIASLSAASLSSASSALNSSAANIWVDLVEPFVPGIGKAKAALFTKIIVVICGIIGIFLAFGIAAAGGTMVQILGTFSSIAGGPSSALYLMGAFIPCVNWKGASAGTVIGIAYGTWITVGSYTIEKQWTPLPTPEANCMLNSDIYNTTAQHDLWSSTTQSHMTTESYTAEGLERMYSLSFLWMREAITAVTIASAVVISFLTGYTKSSEIESHLMHPIMSTILPLKKTKMAQKHDQEMKKHPDDISKDSEMGSQSHISTV